MAVAGAAEPRCAIAAMKSSTGDDDGHHGHGPIEGVDDAVPGKGGDEPGDRVADEDAGGGRDVEDAGDGLTADDACAGEVADVHDDGQQVRQGRTEEAELHGSGSSGADRAGLALNGRP